MAEFGASRTKVEQDEHRGEIMRLTILAGLILGTSLAVQSMLGAHARAKLGPAASAVRVHIHEVAPWYVARNDVAPGVMHLAEARVCLARS